jgi:hypothetical protein
MANINKIEQKSQKLNLQLRKIAAPTRKGLATFTPTNILLKNSL